MNSDWLIVIIILTLYSLIPFTFWLLSQFNPSPTQNYPIPSLTSLSTYLPTHSYDFRPSPSQRTWA